MSGLDESVLSRFLERTFLPTVPDSGAVVDMTIERLEHGWYGAHKLELLLHDRSRHSLFLKDFGTPRGHKEDLEGRRERERKAYECLLDSTLYGTARCYGSEWNAAAGRFWLLLEWVHGTPLRYEELEWWHRAAAWLARFHAGSRRIPVGTGSHPWLRRHDTDFFLRTSDGAVAAVSEWSQEDGARMENGLVGYREQVHRLSSGPDTLVHGAFLPIQILVTAGDGKARVCPLDWELAAVGSQAYDLGFLAYGFDDADKAELLAAYVTEAERVGVKVPPDLTDCVTLVETHRTLDALSRCLERGYDDDSIRRYLSLLDHLTERIGSGSRQARPRVEAGGEANQ